MHSRRYQRVSDGCRAALFALGGLLRCGSLRHAHKNSIFPLADDLLQMEKKYQAVILPADREGVSVKDEMSMEGSTDETGSKSDASRRGRHRTTRKAPTDDQNADFLRAVANRPPLPAPLAK